MEYRYHPEIEGLKINEDGTEVFLFEKPVIIKVRKSGNHPFRFFYYKGSQIGLARLVLECWNGIADHPKLTAKYIDGNHNNYHHSNLYWSNNGGNSKYPPKINPDQKKEIFQKINDGISDSIIAREYGVSRNAIFNLRKKQEK